MNYSALLYAPVYAALGVDATLTVAGVDYAIRAIDKTAGVQVGDLGIETLAPAAAIRAADLAAFGLTSADLDDAVLTLAGADWRVTAARPLPSPGGEADGEYLLLLERASDPEPI